MKSLWPVVRNFSLLRIFSIKYMTRNNMIILLCSKNCLSVKLISSIEFGDRKSNQTLWYFILILNHTRVPAKITLKGRETDLIWHDEEASGILLNQFGERVHNNPQDSKEPRTGDGDCCSGITIHLLGRRIQTQEPPWSWTKTSLATPAQDSVTLCLNPWGSFGQPALLRLKLLSWNH